MINLIKFVNLNKKSKKKKIVIAIHGFGRRRYEDLDELITYLKNKNILVKAPALFDQTIEYDHNYQDWINRALNACTKYLDHDIYLIGYSMGGVIASYIASKIKVKKLILLSPAFDYLNTKTLKKVVVDKFISKEEDDEHPELPSDFYDTFRTICSTYKNSIENVSCPIILFHGTNDQTIPTSSTRWAYNKIKHDKKLAIYIENGSHHLVNDEIIGKQIIELITYYIEKE